MNYSQGSIVAFDNYNMLSGIGKICGKANEDDLFILEVIKANYPIPNETYPYTHVAIPKNRLSCLL